MSIQQSVRRDERTVAVENASYRWAFSFVTIALLIDVMCRAVLFDEAAWDLMALVIVPGIACGVYHARQGILGRGWLWNVTIVGVVAALLAALVAIAATLLRAP
jgi:hypothetical protein